VHKGLFRSKYHFSVARQPFFLFNWFLAKYCVCLLANTTSTSSYFVLLLFRRKPMSRISS